MVRELHQGLQSPVQEHRRLPRACASSQQPGRPASAAVLPLFAQTSPPAPGSTPRSPAASPPVRHTHFVNLRHPPLAISD